ncbi:MAG: class E sortase [Actinomycetota bacterium]|nr:class E sortase [Actinomycetota bacterium]
MRVRKLLLLIVVLGTVTALTACGSKEEGQTSSDANVPQGPAKKQEQNDGPSDKTLRLTVPSMERINDAPVPDTYGEDEDSLKDHVGIHLEGTGFPWQDEANVYVAGHRLGYPGTPSFLAFYDLDNVKEGDQISVTDADGKEYDYKVFQVFTVDPSDLYVTEPVEGRNVLTLQSCTLPDYAQRLIVQAELQES